jgi:hypothetical protein
VLSGIWGTISVGGVGQPGGTVILDGNSEDIAPISNLAPFLVIGSEIPEPTTGSLLGLGLLVLTAASRRRARTRRES